jgi:hypothetical protein
VGASQPPRVEASWTLEQSQSQVAYTPGKGSGGGGGASGQDTQRDSGSRAGALTVHGRNVAQEYQSTHHSQQFVVPALPSSMMEPSRREMGIFTSGRLESTTGAIPFTPSRRTETMDISHTPSITNLAFNSSQMSSPGPASQSYVRPQLPRSDTLPYATLGRVPTSFISSSGEMTPGLQGGGSFAAQEDPTVVPNATPHFPSLPSTATQLPPSSAQSSSSSQRATQSIVVPPEEKTRQQVGHTTGYPYPYPPPPQPTMDADTTLRDRSETTPNVNSLSTLELEKMVVDVINEPGFTELVSLRYISGTCCMLTHARVV